MENDIINNNNNLINEIINNNNNSNTVTNNNNNNNFIDKIPKFKRTRNSETIGKLDDEGFFRTPNGSFWDIDGEYFNKYGFDIHGGCYKDGFDYIPGKDWIEELGCYPEDKDKYLKDEDFDEEEDIENIQDELDKINMQGGNEDFNKFEEEISKNKENDKKNKKNKKDKKKEKEIKKDNEEDEEWEEIDD